MNPHRSSGTSSSSFEFRPSQSIGSTIVDLVCIAAVVYLAKVGVREPVVWSILSGLIVGRFGVSHSKTMERSNRGDGGGGGPGGGGSWGPGPVPPTDERDPRTFPRALRSTPTPRPPIPREDPDSDPPGRPPSPGRRARPSARQRLSAWLSSSGRGAAPMPWWSRRAVAIPLTSVHVSALSLAVVVVLLAGLATTIAWAGRPYDGDGAAEPRGVAAGYGR